MLSTHQASSRHHVPSGVLDRRDIKQPEGTRGGHWDNRPGALALQGGDCRVGAGSAWSRAGFGAVRGFGGSAAPWGLTPGSNVILCDGHGAAAIASCPAMPFPTASAERRQRFGAEDT